MEKERITQERNFCIFQIFKKISLISECTDQKNLKMCIIVKVKNNANASFVFCFICVLFAFFDYFIVSSLSCYEY
jgi:hypothetical protein